MKYYIEDIRINKDNGLIHAALINENGELSISATLDYIIQSCIDRNYEVTNLDIGEKRYTIRFIDKQ